MAGSLREAGIAVECLGVDRRRPDLAVLALAQIVPTVSTSIGPELPVPRERGIETREPDGRSTHGWSVACGWPSGRGAGT